MKVLNFGSLNIDYTYRLEHIVAPGETISSRGLEVFPGGKGLNQSVALARAGTMVYHAGLIGSDGRFLKQHCQDCGVRTDFIRETGERTGNAIIQVTDQGENSIILFPGANRCMTREFIDSVLDHFEKGDMLLLQNEINLVDYLVEAGHAKGMVIALNASPYDQEMKKCDLSKVDLFLLNEVEGAQITGKTQPDEILAQMKVRYPKAWTVLTLGRDGSIYSSVKERCVQPAIEVTAVDTTAAGDTFTGYFLTGFLAGKPHQEVLETAAYAAALAVSRKGASVSIPEKEEVVKYIEDCQITDENKYEN